MGAMSRFFETPSASAEAMPETSRKQLSSSSLDRAPVSPSLEELEWTRVVSVPRVGGDSDAKNRVRTQELAGLIDAYVLGAPIAVAWMRRAAREPLGIFLAGPFNVDRDDGDIEAPLLYPPGARGYRTTAKELARDFKAMPAWTRCRGIVDSILLSDPPRSDAQAPRGPFEEYVAYLARRPFAWLVLATPHAASAIDTELDDLRRQILGFEDRADRSEEQRLALERARFRYRELTRARSAGLWDVHVLVGGEGPIETSQTAALLCSGSDLGSLPYRLVPSGEVDALKRVLASSLEDPRSGASPFVASTELLVAIARMPEMELSGVRMATSPEFDTTPELAASRKSVDHDSVGSISVGTVLDVNLQPAEELTISTRTLNRHTFVCGATGSGKSQTVRTLLQGLSTELQTPIPWMVIEPAKAEYSRMVGRLGSGGDVLVIRPGDGTLVPASLNPLEPAPGYPLQSHLDMVRMLFLAAFDAVEPFPQVLSQALTRCYERCGWDLATGQPVPAWAEGSERVPRYPTLGDLQRECRQVVLDVGYGDDTRNNVLGFVTVRIGSLRLGSPGRFLEGGHPLDFDSLMDRNVVLEIERVTSDQDKAFIIGVVLTRLFEHLRVKASIEEQAAEELRHITVIEEAHRLLKNVPADRPSTTAQAVEFFASLLAEVRAYGEGVIVAEQIPAKIIPDVIKNTALKVVHRLPAEDDRRTVGATMNLTPEQSEYAVTLAPGKGAIFADGMDRPLLVEIPDRVATEGGVADYVPPLVRERRRHWACSASCMADACDLARMRRAAHLGESSPELVLWCEVILLAHVMGMRGVRMPSDSWVRHQVADDRRTVECALAEAIQASVSDRYRYLVEFYPPEDLAVHVMAVLMHRLLPDDADDPCGVDEVSWAAGSQRWVDILESLRDDDGDREKPHRDTKQWRLERGLDLRGPARDAQLAELLAHPWTHYEHQQKMYRGDGEQPRIELAAALISPAVSPRDSVEQCLDFMTIEQRRFMIEELYGRPEPSAKEGSTS